MIQEIVQQKTKEASDAIKVVLQKFNQETGLTISEIEVKLLEVGSKEGTAYLVNNIQFKIIS